MSLINEKTTLYKLKLTVLSYCHGLFLGYPKIYMAKGLSFSGYAAYRKAKGLIGGTTSAVSQAVSAGRITPNEDGLLIPEIADAEWLRNTRPRSGTGRTRVPEEPQLWESPPLIGDEVTPPTAPPAAVITPEPIPPNLPPKIKHGRLKAIAEGTSLLQARTAHEIFKAQRTKLGLAREKNKLIDRDQALAHVFELARNERESWMQWPSRVAGSMAESLGIDAHKFIFMLETAVHKHLQELGQPKINIGGNDGV